MTAYCPVCDAMVDVKVTRTGAAMWAGDRAVPEATCAECGHDDLYTDEEMTKELEDFEYEHND